MKKYRMVKFPKFFNLHPITQILIALLLIVASYSLIQIVISIIEIFVGDIFEPLIRWSIVLGVSVVGLMIMGVSSKKIRRKLFG